MGYVVEALNVLEQLVLNVVDVNGGVIKKLGFYASERRFRDRVDPQFPRRLMRWIIPSSRSRDRYADEV